MKKLLLGMLLAGIALFLACRQDNDNPELLADEIANSDLKSLVRTELLPTEISDYVALNGSPFDIEDAYHTPGSGYEVWLGDGQELYFDERGGFLYRRPHRRTDRGYGPAGERCMRGDTITVENLPVAVLDYIAANYRNVTPGVVVDKRSRLYAVELSNGVILLFNREGTRIRECDGLSDGTRRCLAGREVRPSELPRTVSTYIGDNYPRLTVEKVVKKIDGLWAVLLSDGAVLLFRPQGSFIGICNG